MSGSYELGTLTSEQDGYNLSPSGMHRLAKGEGVLKQRPKNVSINSHGETSVQ